mmetsp:Transcript_83253/g.131681  ORF Transcript_83253/g.131681 Transcript_83253/m.131681 type:complete len:296 (-) Transcript_83253:2233-3120(-)
MCLLELLPAVVPDVGLVHRVFPREGGVEADPREHHLGLEAIEPHPSVPGVEVRLIASVARAQVRILVLHVLLELRHGLILCGHGGQQGQKGIFIQTSGWIAVWARGAVANVVAGRPEASRIRHAGDGVGQTLLAIALFVGPEVLEVLHPAVAPRDTGFCLPHEEAVQLPAIDLRSAAGSQWGAAHQAFSGGAACRGRVLPQIRRSAERQKLLLHPRLLEVEGAGATVVGLILCIAGAPSLDRLSLIETQGDRDSLGGRRELEFAEQDLGALDDIDALSANGRLFFGGAQQDSRAR